MDFWGDNLGKVIDEEGFFIEKGHPQEGSLYQSSEGGQEWFLRNHRFVGSSSTCDYPCDHPDENSCATEQTAEVCGRSREEHET